MFDTLPYREIWAVDFEFRSESGEQPDPVCLVARELKTGRQVRHWRDQFGSAPPYATDADALFVAYYASAEIGCHLGPRLAGAGARVGSVHRISQLHERIADD